MKAGVVLCLISIGVVVLAKPYEISTDKNFVKELDAALAEAEARPTTQRVHQGDDVNNTSEEGDYSHSLEHHDHDDDQDDDDDRDGSLSHEQGQDSGQSVESDEHQGTHGPWLGQDHQVSHHASQTLQDPQLPQEDYQQEAAAPQLEPDTLSDQEQQKQIPPELPLA